MTYLFEFLLFSAENFFIANLTRLYEITTNITIIFPKKKLSLMPLYWGLMESCAMTFFVIHELVFSDFSFTQYRFYLSGIFNQGNISAKNRPK